MYSSDLVHSVICFVLPNSCILYMNCLLSRVILNVRSLLGYDPSRLLLSSVKTVHQVHGLRAMHNTGNVLRCQCRVFAVGYRVLHSHVSQYVLEPIETPIDTDYGACQFVRLVSSHVLQSIAFAHAVVLSNIVLLTRG